jgi:hypothetical protein
LHTYIYIYIYIHAQHIPLQVSLFLSVLYNYIKLLLTCNWLIQVGSNSNLYIES